MAIHKIRCKQCAKVLGILNYPNVDIETISTEIVQSIAEQRNTDEKLKCIVEIKCPKCKDSDDPIRKIEV